MSKDFKNQLVGQTGEHLACAELGRRGYIATSFSGNVPEFDLIVANENLRTIPIQIKTSTSGKWPTKATDWLDITIDETNKVQNDNGLKEIDNPNLIYICIYLANEENKHDRFYILTKKELQNVCALHYRSYMEKCNWKRPKKYDSLDLRYNTDDLKNYENNWELIEKLIK